MQFGAVAMVQKIPLHIAFCITTLDPGGAERQLVRLACGLDRSEFSPEVIYFKGDGALAQPLQAAGIPVTRVDARHRWDVSIVPRLQHHFRRGQPTIVQSFLHHANIVTRIAAHRAGVRCIVSGIRVAERRRGLRLWVDRYTERWVQAHVCVSSDVAQFSVETGGLNPRKVVIIPNAVDLSSIANATPASLAEYGIPARGVEPLSAPVLLSVGRLDQQKDPFLLLEAFRLIQPEFPNATLLYAGEGPLRESLADAAVQVPGVHLLGFRTDVPGLLKAATLLALTSRWEGMPNVVLEAMAAGTPVVAANVEGVHDLLGECGHTFRPGSLSELCGQLRYVLTKPREASNRALHLQTVAQQKFASSTMVAAYADLYRKLVSLPH